MAGLTSVLLLVTNDLHSVTHCLVSHNAACPSAQRMLYSEDEVKKQYPPIYEVIVLWNIAWLLEAELSLLSGCLGSTHKVSYGQSTCCYGVICPL
jgi:hypothetical protein